MKKTNLKSALIVAAIAISGFGAWKVSCIYENENKRYTSMMIQNIEALANGDEDPWADCPRNQYIRNAKEYWKAYTVKYDADLGFHISVNGKNIKLGAGVNVGGTVFVPTCSDSNGNCCEKSHQDKPFRYA